ncbi:hypothetical protein [Nocardioides panacis]|nr:hypothetical protein [Nocardioides panacis]
MTRLQVTPFLSETTAGTHVPRPSAKPPAGHRSGARAVARTRHLP